MKKVFVALSFLLLLPLVATTEEASPPASRASFINGLSHDGQQVTCDLPGSQQISNIGSKLDGAGMCVYSAMEMAAIYSGLEQMRGFRNWVADNYNGGGWPDKVDEVLANYFKVKGIKPIPYIQYEGTEPESVMALADKTGRPVCTTYGYSPRYGRSIQHMVNLMGFKKYGIILDNNFTGEDRMEWALAPEIARRSIYPNKQAWLFVWLAPPPPHSPKNIINQEKSK